MSGGTIPGKNPSHNGTGTIRIIMEKNLGDLVVRVTYPKEVWRKLESAYKKAGLELYETNSLFGHLHAKVYRYRDSTPNILSHVRNMMSQNYCSGEVIDDINGPLIELDRYNMAIFRVVPTCDNNSNECITEIRLRDGSLLFTKPHMKCYTIALKFYIQSWLQLGVTASWRYESIMEISW